jgi:transposase
VDARQERGQQIAETKRLRRKGDLWIVPSQAGAGTYIVDPTETRGATCTCPDYETRGTSCKHVYAVEFTIQRETVAVDGATVTETVKLTYRQEWPAYNAAQVHEKQHVADLLRDLCSAIDNPVQKVGRPRLPLSDAVFCAVMKVYGTTSGRRAMSDLRDYAAKGYIDRAPHYNSVFNALENPDLTPLLKAMIAESATPLKAMETDFAVDSSGFSTVNYERWFSVKYGRELTRSKWLKAHVIVGTATNVVTSVEVTDNYGPDAHDTIHLPALLNATKRGKFDVQKLSADKAYLTKKNLVAINEAGAFPLIPFKVNSVAFHATGEGADLWRKAFWFFTHRREEFLSLYHRRSNVETAFSMVKAKFGASLRSKTPVAQRNELLAKILCHNLACVTSAIYELGIAPEFWTAA